MKPTSKKVIATRREKSFVYFEEMQEMPTPNWFERFCLLFVKGVAYDCESSPGGRTKITLKSFRGKLYVL